MSFFMSLTRQIIVLIPCILIMSKLFGVEGVWFAGPTADFIATMVTFSIYKMELKHLKELEIKVQT